MSDKYVLDGKVPRLWKGSLEEWARRVYGRAPNANRVAFTDFADGYVSTIFLGLDHNHWGQGAPILFETMIFGGKESDYQVRCSTWEEAEEQHKVAVAIATGQVARMR